MNEQALQWLWEEIARRFGQEQAAELRSEFRMYQSSPALDPRVSEYQRELTQLEERLQQLEQAGEPETAYMRSLRWGIDYRRQMIQEARSRALV